MNADNLFDGPEVGTYSWHMGMAQLCRKMANEEPTKADGLNNLAQLHVINALQIPPDKRK